MNGVEDRGRAPIVALHERSGTWGRQLRPRLSKVRARWFETRTTAELLAAVAARASPVVLVEAGADPERALRDLAALSETGSAPLVLFLDPWDDRPETLRLAGELGATLATTSKAMTPPEVADLIGRWIALAARAQTREGWSRPIPADPAREPDEWIDAVVAEAVAAMES